MEFNRELALVTGASSGIGAELARLMAARGANLVLTARRLDRLQSLADELATRHAITAMPIASDLNTPDGADRLVEELAARGLNPSILINNAGFGYFSPFTVQ